MTNETDYRQIAAQEISSLIRQELSTTVSSAKAGTPVDIESMVETMRKFVGDLNQRKLITKPDFSNDLKVSSGSVPVYKVSYKIQLNSVQFITGKEEIKTKEFTLGDEDIEKALEKAKNVVPKGAHIVGVLLDHWEEDRSRINIEYTYRPVIDLKHYMMHCTVTV